MAQGRNLVSASGSTSQYSRQKCMSSSRVVENLDRNICILSDSQVPIKALSDHLKTGLGLPPVPRATG
jgi:hypothetical protein